MTVYILMTGHSLERHLWCAAFSQEKMDMSVSAAIAIGGTAQSACNYAVEKIQKATPSQMILPVLG